MNTIANACRLARQGKVIAAKKALYEAAAGMPLTDKQILRFTRNFPRNLPTEAHYLEPEDAATQGKDTTP